MKNNETVKTIYGIMITNWSGDIVETDVELYNSKKVRDEVYESRIEFQRKIKYDHQSYKKFDKILIG